MISPAPPKPSFGARVLRFFGWCFVLFFIAPVFILCIVGIFTRSPAPTPNKAPANEVKARTRPRVDSETAKRQNHERWVSNLVAEINVAQGEDREAKLKKLLTLEPNTKEFPEEVQKIREAEQKIRDLADDFVRNGVGKKVPTDRGDDYGRPLSLDSGDEKHSVAYLPNIDVSFVVVKATDTVIYAAHGRESAGGHLKRQKEARKNRIESGFSAWNGSHLALTRTIKAAMNDPKSYDHVQTTYWDMGDHLIVKTTFRGKNGFGALVLNSVKAKTSLDGQVLEVLEQGP